MLLERVSIRIEIYILRPLIEATITYSPVLFNKDNKTILLKKMHNLLLTVNPLVSSLFQIYDKNLLILIFHSLQNRELFITKFPSTRQKNILKNR